MQNAIPVQRWQWIWPAVVAGLIVVASSRSRLAGGPDIPNFDKVVHFAVYGLLGTLVTRMGRGWRAAAGAVLAVSLFGATDEWHQSFVPGRMSDVRDWIADTLGAAAGAALYAGWPGYRRRLEAAVLQRRVENAVPPATITS